MGVVQPKHGLALTISIYEGDSKITPNIRIMYFMYESYLAYLIEGTTFSLFTCLVLVRINLFIPFYL